MPENGQIIEGELSLFDLWKILRNAWCWIAGGVVLGSVGGGLTVAVLPPQYEAVALVQVGQVGQVGQITSVPVEQPLQAIERMRTGNFQYEAAKSSGYAPWVEISGRSTKAGSAFFSLQLVKNTYLIEIRAKAETPHHAEMIAKAIIEVLSKRHAELAEPMIENLRFDLALARERLKSAEDEVASLGAAAASARLKDDRFTQFSLLASMRKFKESEVFAQQKMVSALNMALSPPATQPAQAVEGVFVAEQPVSPKKGIIAVLGVFGGLMLGLFATFVSNAWQSAKKRKS